MSSEIKKAPLEIHYFRKSLVLVQIGYYLSLLPRWTEFFSASGWIQGDYLEENYSLLQLFDSDAWRWGLLIALVAMLVMFFFGRLNRIGFILLYIINLSFYHWNPLIIHEPQPITNLFFLSFFFLPLNDNQERYDPWIKNILILFLGLYYFLAGIKKLPDPHFLSGVALEQIISWSVMAKNLNLNLFLIDHFTWLLRPMNYVSLFFEIAFIFFVFTRFRPYLIIIGVIMHALIYLTLEVGNFSFVMMVWYVLLLDEKTRDWFVHFLKKRPFTGPLRFIR